MLISRWCILPLLSWCAFQISEVTRKYFWVEVFKNTGKSFWAFSAGVGFCQSLAAHSPIRSTSLHLTLSTLGECTLSLLHIGQIKNKKWCEFPEEVVLMGSLNMKKQLKVIFCFFAFIHYLIVFDISIDGSGYQNGWIFGKNPKKLKN